MKHTCHFCDKEIKGEPVTVEKERTIYNEVDKDVPYDVHYCDEKCKAFDEMSVEEYEAECIGNLSMIEA